MFSPEEIDRLYALKEQVTQEEYARQLNTTKHLAFLRWLVQHGKMEADTAVSDVTVSWKEQV